MSKDLSVINDDISIKKSFNEENDKVMSINNPSCETITNDMKLKIEDNVKTIANEDFMKNENNNVELLDGDFTNIETIPIVDINTSSFDRKYLEEHGVLVDEALELLGDMDMYNSTVKDFLEEASDKWDKVVEFKNTSNMKDYAIEVHSLKSDFKYLGFMDLAEIFYQHELKSKENDINFVLNNFDKLEEEFMKALEILKNYSTNIKK